MVKRGTSATTGHPVQENAAQEGREKGGGAPPAEERCGGRRLLAPLRGALPAGRRFRGVASPGSDHPRLPSRAPPGRIG